VHSDLTTKSVASLADFNKIYYTYFWATLTPCMCVMANHMYTEHTCYNAPVYRYVLTMVLPRPYSFLTTYSQPHSFCLSYVLCVAAACRRQLMWNRPPLLWRRHRRIHRRVGGGARTPSPRNLVWGVLDRGLCHCEVPYPQSLLSRICIVWRIQLKISNICDTAWHMDVKLFVTIDGP